MAANPTRRPAGPLDGITVLDLCSYLAGPYGCTLLADLGANVIKIESPQGDMLRQFPSSLPGEARFFLINPRLIYAGLAGYGDRGPLSETGGFDQALQCLSGLAAFQGGGTEKPQLVLGSVLDYFTSALLAYGVAAALFQREKTGKGQYLSLSLLRSALTIQAGRFVWAESEGRDVARDSGTGGLTGIHPTKDGALYISVHSNHFWAALCELIGRPELAGDARCASMRSRAQYAAELVPEVRAALAARSAREWGEVFGERVPCAAVRPIEEMFDHPQVLAEEMVTTIDHPVVGRYRTMTKPVHFADTPGPTPTAAPVFGQHSDEVLAEHGFSAADIAALRERGVVR